MKVGEENTLYLFSGNNGLRVNIELKIHQSLCINSFIECLFMVKRSPSAIHHPNSMLVVKENLGNPS